MNPRESRDNHADAEWRARFGVLQTAPPPNLNRGRGRVLALAQQRFAAPAMPRRATYALALAIGLAVIFVMVVMSSAMGALDLTSVGLTRTDTWQARTMSPKVVPANAMTPVPNDRITLIAPRTPVPFGVPEPPRSPSVLSTQTLAP